MAIRIRTVRALQVLDSRGNPTIETEIALSDGTTARAQVPSGASTGRHEAKELRDGPAGAFEGKSVSTAAANVCGPLNSALRGLSADDPTAIDQVMVELDGTPDKSRLGANAILSVSCALARAISRSRRIPLWQLLAGPRVAKMPLPMVNILSGGLHAGRQIEFQDFLAVPHGLATFAEALEAAALVRLRMGEILRAEGLAPDGVADEGGWGPRLESNEQALEFMVRAISAAGFEPGKDVSIAVDVAASHFYRDGEYRLASERRSLDSAGMISLFDRWSRTHPVISFEDPLAEDDWIGWQQACSVLGRRCELIGDDLLATNPSRLEKAIDSRAATAVLVKMNQIGTLSETMRVVDRAEEAGFRAVVSARSGETEDAFLADLAVASGAGHIKVGSVARSERLAKYNRLLRIEAGWDGQVPEPLAPIRPLGHHGVRGDERVNDA